MGAAGEQDQLRARNGRSQESSFFGTDGQVVTAMDDERRRRELPEELTPIAPPVARLVVAGGGVGIRRDALQLVEVRDQARVGIRAKELT